MRQVKEAGLIPEDQVRLCAIGDGAGWIWKWVEELFPSARQILDYYIVAVTCMRWPRPNTAPMRRAPAIGWKRPLARLFCGEGTGVVWGLQRMQPVST